MDNIRDIIKIMINMQNLYRKILIQVSDLSIITQKVVTHTNVSYVIHKECNISK